MTVAGEKAAKHKGETSSAGGGVHAVYVGL